MCAAGFIRLAEWVIYLCVCFFRDLSSCVRFERAVPIAFCFLCLCVVPIFFFSRECFRLSHDVRVFACVSCPVCVRFLNLNFVFRVFAPHGTTRLSSLRPMGT